MAKVDVKIAQAGNIKTNLAKVDVKLAQAGNIKTKVAKADVKIAGLVNTTTKLNKHLLHLIRAKIVPQAFTKIMGAVQFAKFVRKVNIKTRMVNIIVKVVFRGNTTPKREQLHLLRAKFVPQAFTKIMGAVQFAKFVRKVNIKTRMVKHIVKVVLRGNTTTKINKHLSLLANLIATLDRTLHLQKVHVLFVRQVHIKTRMVKHLVKVVFRGNTTTKQEKLHANFVVLVDHRIIS